MTSTERAGTSTVPPAKPAAADGLPSGIDVSNASAQRQSRCASGHVTATAASLALKARPMRGAGAPSRSAAPASTAISSRRSACAQSSAAIARPSGCHQTMSGGPPSASACPVSQRSARSGGCARRNASSAATNSARAASARTQSTQVSGVSCA
jgi:hypothetical protein